MKVLKDFFRRTLRLWSRIGIAPGFLHKMVDRYSPNLHTTVLRRRIRGGEISCDLRDHVQSRIFFFGAYEPIEAYLFSQIIEPDMHIVDAGANVGFYSIFSSSKLSDRGRVYSFEPIPSNFDALEQNIDQSHAKHIDTFNHGLWSEKKELTFSLSHHFSDNQGSFSASPVSTADQQFKCPVDTLDNLHSHSIISKVDLIKMDIEGAELFALEGAKEILESYRPSIMLEINQGACKAFDYSSSDIDELLKPYGYKIFNVRSLPENSGFIDSTRDIIQGNVFFLSEKDLSRFPKNWDYKAIKKYFASPN